MLTLSGHVESLFLLCCIASWTSVVMSVMFFFCSLCVFLSMYLFVFDCVGEFLLHAFAIWVDEVIVSL